MRAKCRLCGEEVGSPAAVSGLTTLMPAALVTGLVAGVAAIWSWWVVLATPIVWLALSWVFWEAPRWAAMLANRFRTCPRCGGRSWERPRYGGFGL